MSQVDSIFTDVCLEAPWWPGEGGRWLTVFLCRSRPSLRANLRFLGGFGQLSCSHLKGLRCLLQCWLCALSLAVGMRTRPGGLTQTMNFFQRQQGSHPCPHLPCCTLGLSDTHTSLCPCLTKRPYRFVGKARHHCHPRLLTPSLDHSGVFDLVDHPPGVYDGCGLYCSHYSQKLVHHGRERCFGLIDPDLLASQDLYDSRQPANPRGTWPTTHWFA